ncbi:hypothetical protein PTKIN_Ptkin08bG0190700 [Pterospermum kingtungense]
MATPSKELASTEFTFIVEDRWQATGNHIFKAAEVYLSTIIGPSSDSLLIGSNDPTAPPQRSIPVGCTIMDDFERMSLKWTFSSTQAKRFFSLTCKKRDRERVEQRYFHFITKTAQAILNNRESLSIYSYDQECSMWESAVFKHPAKFETLAMESEFKQSIMDDLDWFKGGKKVFENVGRAWRRGYLLHGPPGTGKSSLVAAIANYMRYDIYDLQLHTVRNDSDLRRALASITNRSILLIEDIDELHPKVTLSGLLNFIDGLWSSCGTERIIIFTTKRREKLDPALIRPGRVDVHICMGYCTPAGFRKLANTYLGIEDDELFDAIDGLIESVEVTAAEVAQQLMISHEPKDALRCLVKFLNMKKKEKVEEGVAEKEEKGIQEKENSKLDESETRCIYLT